MSTNVCKQTAPHQYDVTLDLLDSGTFRVTYGAECFDIPTYQGIQGAWAKYVNCCKHQIACTGAEEMSELRAESK